MVTVVGQNGSWQKTCVLESLRVDAVNRIGSVTESASGKGANLTRALAAFGVPARLLAYAGGPTGRRFRRACRHALRLDCRFVATAGETRVCTTLLEEASGAMTELIEPSARVTGAESAAFRRLFSRTIRRSDFLAVAGTAAAGEDEGRYAAFVAEARRRGVPVLLDSYTAHGRAALAASPEILKVNQAEFEQLAGRPLADAAERTAAYGEFLAAHGLRWIVVTRGGDGLEGTNGRDAFAVRSEPVEAANPIGSGDAASAGLIYALSRRPGGERSPIDWDDAGLLRAALAEAAAFGTANCLNREPGRIDRADYERIKEGLAVAPVGRR